MQLYENSFVVFYKKLEDSLNVGIKLSKDNKYLVRIPLDIGTSILTIIIWILIVIIILMLIGLGLIYILRSKNRKRQEIEEQIYENF